MRGVPGPMCLAAMRTEEISHGGLQGYSTIISSCPTCEKSSNDTGSVMSTASQVHSIGVTEKSDARHIPQPTLSGTHGRTGIGKLLLGSAAEAIFREAPCPVLTVGPQALAQPSREGEFTRILYATRFSAESAVAAPYAISLAQEYQAKLTLLHVLENPKAGDLIVPQDLMESSKARLANLLPPEGELWCQLDYVVERGEVAEKILDVAKNRKADLIVLGVHRPSGVPGAATHLPIATAHKVVCHANCPVLTVRD